MKDFDDMNHMPDWNNFKNFTADGEEWKDASKLERAENLYNQAKLVYKYAAIFCETLTGDLAEDTSALIMQSAIMLCPKIVAAEGGDLYIIRMENASIIRTTVKELSTQVRAAFLYKNCKDEDMKIVVEEISKFRVLFIEWVKHFKKDDFEDEWGLY